MDAQAAARAAPEENEWQSGEAVMIIRPGALADETGTAKVFTRVPVTFAETFPEDQTGTELRCEICDDCTKCTFLSGGNCRKMVVPDIGRKMLCVNELGKITEISVGCRKIIEKLGLDLGIGDSVSESEGVLIAKEAWKMVEEAAGLSASDNCFKKSRADDGMNSPPIPGKIIFYGKSADDMDLLTDNPFEGGDLGYLIGQAVWESRTMKFYDIRLEGQE